MNKPSSFRDTDLTFVLQWEDASPDQVRTVILQEVYPYALRLAVDALGSAEKARSTVLKGLARAERVRAEFAGQSDAKVWVLEYVEREILSAGRAWGLKPQALSRVSEQPELLDRPVARIPPGELKRLEAELADMARQRDFNARRRFGELAWILAMVGVVFAVIVRFNRSGAAEAGEPLLPTDRPPAPSAVPGDRTTTSPGWIFLDNGEGGFQSELFLPGQNGQVPAPWRAEPGTPGQTFAFFQPQPYDAHPSQQVFLIEDGQPIDPTTPLAILYSLSTREFSSRTGQYIPIPGSIPEEAVFLGQRNSGSRIVTLVYELPLSPYQTALLTVHLPTGVGGPELAPEDFPDRRTGASAEISRVSLGAAGVPGELAIGGWVFVEEGAVGIPTDKAWVVVEGETRWVGTLDRMILRWELDGILFELAVSPTVGAISGDEEWITAEALLRLAGEVGPALPDRRGLKPPG